MRNLTATLCLTISVLLGSAGVSWSADFQKGETAYQSGDYATALREWEPLAKQGNASAQNNLGVMYATGKGVPYSGEQAFKWYSLAAEQGVPTAQHEIAFSLFHGLGAPKDRGAAFRWFTEAAKNGNARSHYFRGIIFEEEGRADLATMSYTLGAELGDTGSQFTLGRKYYFGSGTIQDYKAAFKWLALALAQGGRIVDPNAILLAILYRDGKGTHKDLIRAHMWLNLESSNGISDHSSELRDLLAEQMTPADISTAQNLARECVAKNYKGC
jgi:TPR repeat protein